MDTMCLSCMESYDSNFNICPHCGYTRGTKTTEPHHMQPETILHKKYIVGKVLGFGGFGVTYIGWDASLNKKVAIKEYLPSEFATRMPGHTEVSVYNGEQAQQLYLSGLKSFVEEAQKLAKFNCDTIVGIDDVFHENKTAYIIMEYLEGESLSDYLKRVGPLPFSIAKDVMISILQTLSLVHKSGIIHRDVSPDNIFITKDGKVKLLDFGSARYATAYNTQSLSVIVKRGYAPPEQYQRHGQQGPWTDNYAAAATLYKMLTGVTPEDSMERINNDRLTRPSAMGVAINPENENALMNALNLSAESRPQTADEFLNGLISGAERTEDEKKTNPSKMPAWLKAVIAAVSSLLVIVVVLFATGIFSISNGRLVYNAPASNGYVRVPEVLRKTKEEAKDILNESELEMLIVGRKEVDERIEKDLICEQTPNAGKKLKIKDEVKVRISDPKLSYVPNALYFAKDTAKKSYENEGLKPVIKEEYSDTVGKGGVIRQTDTEDTCRFYGDESEIIISMGPENPVQTGTVTVPDLNGKDFEMVRKELLSQSVYLLISEAKYDNNAVENTIIGQKTAAGTTVNKGENIYVTISLGKEKVRVPDVQYLDETKAIEKLEGFGFKVETTSVESDIVEKDLVVSQSFEGGMLIEKGSTVSLEISEGKPESNSSDSAGNSKNENCNNVKICLFDNEYYYIGNVGEYEKSLFKYDFSTKKETQFLSEININSISIFDNTMYVIQDNNICKVDCANQKLDIIYSEEYINSVFFYDNYIAYSTNNEIGLLNIADASLTAEKIEGSIIDLIDGEMYYQNTSSTSKIIQLKKYNFTSKKTTILWSSSFEEIFDYYYDFYGPICIFDLIINNNTIYITAGQYQGSGYFYEGKLIEIGSENNSFVYSNYVGPGLFSVDNNLYVSMGGNKYSGQYGLWKIDGHSLTTYDEEIYQIGTLHNGKILNKKNSSLYLYSINDKSNSCVLDGQKFLTESDNEINDFMNSGSIPFSVEKSYFSVDYTDTMFDKYLIITKPRIGIPAGMTDNQYHEVKSYDYQFVTVDNQ